jgi:hypothetical protein
MENHGSQGPEPAVPLIPARILNEYIYCLRLAYLEWIHSEFADSAYRWRAASKLMLINYLKFDYLWVY